ncbi:ABC transporter ATP-binding protein [Azospirillum sp. RWY-5-1]|uniref:ABC transporter ATP-binding protein n=1 Tax=Azospirillum oleiclasticum TaxID=2735135 RepID=A0ABX2TFX2_9PROT|nr:ABC transporter ATP-binding protein [Azospirillum oleiclasticum]NYZ14411.1 ABC transporter ATP-binding protein [Azospirillum oleiclasticum]NYZ23237.1 ABC transporter ATP-binding protein [Azospirillum oleiclasticum]
MIPRRPIGDVLLSARSISLSFGGVKALNDISIEVRRHEILSIIGPNGAGKTSMLNVINGVYHPQAGDITFRGRRWTRMGGAEAAAQGIARTFQNVALFRGMSVLDNILSGRARRFRASIVAQALNLPHAVREEVAERGRVEELIEFLDLQAVRRTPVGTLPYGLQKRVELARALAAEPELLLLDEPMAGMTFEEKQDMCRFVLDVNRVLGTTVVLIEHDIGVVMDLSDRIAVLDYGRKIADGPPDAVRGNAEVIAAYLGTNHGIAA